MSQKSMSQKIIFSFLVTLMLGLSTPAHAAQPAPADNQISVTYDDPFEGFNRAVFNFNRVLDQTILRPVAQGYQFILPEVIRSSVSSFLKNLGSPLALINEILQGDIDGATTVAKRFVVNSTLGFAGLADPAGHHGLPAPDVEDFGQTFAVWGAEPGPYLVLPIFGPSSFRDTFGKVADTIGDPVNIWAVEEDEEGFLIARGVFAGVNTRTKLLGTLQPIYEDSLDPYMTFKTMYEQRRESQIRDIVNNTRKNAAVVSQYDSYDSY